jgi:predicted ester cyclase
MNDTPNAKVVREFTRVFKNQHNVDAIDHLFAPGFAHHFASPVRPGLAGFKDVGRMMNAAFPDVVVTEEDLILGGDKVVERSSARATHRGDLMGSHRPIGASSGPRSTSIDWQTEGSPSTGSSCHCSGCSNSSPSTPEPNARRTEWKT